MSDWLERIETTHANWMVRRERECRELGMHNSLSDHGADAVFVARQIVAPDDVLEFARDVDGLLRRCESPIERAFMCAALIEIRHRDHLVVWNGPGVANRYWSHRRFVDASAAHGRTHAWSKLHVGDTYSRFALYPQIKIGKYRADFLLVYRDVVWASDRAEDFTERVVRKTMVIECDGHDYHERTKEQASRDKARDRYMQARGHMVYRFSGSDIWADPFNCATECARALMVSTADAGLAIKKAAEQAQGATRP